MWDYFVHTAIDYESNTATVTVDVDFLGLPSTEARAALIDNGKVLEAFPLSQKLTFTVQNPRLWTAEEPNLYQLVFKNGTEVISELVGIREITVENAVVKVNGKPIKCKGVNRHDSYPDTGYAASREQILQDLTLMKEHNVNAIRTSHYPNCPEMVQLCTRYGFYLIDEADIETHGVCSCQYQGDYSENYDLLAIDPQFELTALDRVQKMVERDKNAPSVIFWSMGNESGYGPNISKAAHWVKDFDPSRLTHYQASMVRETGKFTGM